jgi:Cytochrome c554 and c-prime
LKICRPKLLLQIIVIFIATLVFGQSASFAETSNSTIKVDQSFDHQNTKFPLEGAHKNITCETCHAGAVFKGVPTTCFGCHNGDMAKGKSADHPTTSSVCSDCHNSTVWAQVHVDHSKISKNCISCHDGQVATGKNKTHVKSVKNCESCHVVSTWRITKFDHSQTNEPCEACHDRIHATGKPFTHMRSSKDCGACHQTVSWNVRTFDHAGVTKDCANCHDGINATGKSQNHIPASNNCEWCHNTITWKGVKFDHNDPAVASQPCLNCHDGRKAVGRAVTHFKTAADCGACHVTTSWTQATFDHSLALDLPNCFSCHNGQRPPALGKNPGHIVSSNMCTDCHTDTQSYTTWKGAKFIHTNVIGGCFACHNGVSATGKLTVNGSHLNTTDSCESCHNTTSFVNWKTAKFDHSQTNGACSTCHDGTKSISFGPIKAKSPAHLDTTDTCETCHNTVKFVPFIKMDHTEAAPTCFSCHSGTKVTSKNNPVTGKVTGHIQASDSCETCHTSFTTWKIATFDHSVLTPADKCESCHNGTNASGKPIGHLDYIVSPTIGCANCHSTITWRPANFDHTVVSGSCVTCHNGTTAISTGLLTTKSSKHIPLNGQACEACHTSTTVWKVAFDHATIGTTTCETCHNGTNATGKTSLSGNHLATSNVCITCHITTSWTAVKFDHKDSGVSGACFTCHNGSTAISTGALKTKSSKHIVTSAACETCHSSYVAWTAIFDHSTLNGQACFSCHNGTNATGKLSISGQHIPSSTNCDTCHVTTAWTPVTPAIVHANTPISTTCQTCHNNNDATGKNPATHIPSGANCSDCHTSQTSWATIAPNFHDFVNGSCVSCHDGTKSTATKRINGKLTISGKHINSTDSCISCHSTTAWTPVAANAVDHGQVVGSCASCHDGLNAKTHTSLTHPQTTAATNCQDCHITTTWTPINGGRPDHSNPAIVAPGQCFTCHNGTTATGKNAATHFASSNTCDNCHNTNLFKPARQFDHTDSGVAGVPCANCHNGMRPPADGKSSAPKGHVKTSDTCDNCHLVGPTWVTTKKIHSAQDPVVDSAECFSCHDGAHPPATAKSATHFKTSNDCKSCHTTVSFTPAVFDHSDPGITGTCVSCHTGMRPPADGKSNAPQGHVKTSDTCDNCHVVGTTWVTSIKIHSVQDPIVEGASCVSCHDGAHPPATPKSIGHFKTSNDCVSCHTELNWTVSKGRFNHSDSVVLGAACFSCHDGAPTHAPAIGKIAGHVPASNACENCHSTVAWVPAHVDHATVAPGSCFTCHNGNGATGKTQNHFKTSNTCDICHNTNLWKPFMPPFHADASITGTCYSCHTGTQAPAKGRSNTHITTTTNCEACHATTPANWKTSVVDHTQVTGTCISCHNGTISTGKISLSGKHMNTTNSCVNCHTTKDTRTKAPAAWKVASLAFDHTQAIGTCNSCHNGTNPPAVGKSQGHITTTTLCEACHTTAAWAPVPAKNVDHAQVTGTCFSCHNGSKATGKSIAHITTSNSCDLCHTTVNWTASIVDHTQVIGTCFSCHNGNKATGKISLSGKHFNTTNTCDACHTTRDTKTKLPTAWPVAKTAFDHSQAIGTCISCHQTGATPVAEVKGTNHFITTQACDVCHTTTNWTTLLPYSHLSPTYVMHSVSSGVTTCLSCHKQNNEKITFLSPSLVPDCAACHSNKYKPDPHIKYGNVRYTFTELRDCTGACHIYTDSSLGTIKTNRATNTKHRSTRSSWN